MTLDSLVWGDIGTWFAGIATFLAVVVAIYYSQRQERRTSRQALANVYAWVEHRTDSGEWRLVVSNGTDAPLYRWTVRFRWTVNGLDDTDEVGNDDIGIIPPGRHTYSLTSADGLPDNDGLVRVSILFVDATGQGWLRTESGDLTPTAYPAAA